MADIKTVDGEVEYLDPIYENQKSGIAKMRAALLSCEDDDMLAKQALNNVTVLRVYHQIARIIRYTEMCDKIEQKIYEALDRSLDTMNPNSPSTWMVLLDAQERLQRILIESQKLLQPYLDVKMFNIIDATASNSDIPNVVQMNSATIRNLQTNARQALLLLKQEGAG